MWGGGTWHTVNLGLEEQEEEAAVAELGVEVFTGDRGSPTTDAWRPTQNIPGTGLPVLVVVAEAVGWGVGGVGVRTRRAGDI